MRIVQLISQTFIGGAESFGFALSAELARRGHSVILLANRLNGPLFEREHPPGMEVRVLDRHSRLDPRIISFIDGAIREMRPDILHSHNFEANTWARTIALLHPGLPVVCHEHSGRKDRHSLRRRWIDRALYRRCAASIVVSSKLETLMRERYRVPADRIHFVLNGIDVAQFAASEDGRDPLGVVSVASLMPVKNHAGMLRAWKRVIATHPGAHLTLVGDGRLRGEVEEQIRSSGLEANVTIAGMQEDVRPFLRRASIFLLFSRTEATPISLLEGMAAGLACVAPAVGEIPTILRDDAGPEVAGRVIPQGDEDALVTALNGLLGDPIGRKALGERGREEVIARYSIERCVDRIESIYAGVARR